MIDAGRACLFIPNGLHGFKQKLFDRIGAKVGRVVRGSFAELAALPDYLIPVVGCTPELRPIIDRWDKQGRAWIYWDRGYVRRVFATWLPRGADGGYYRWHLRSYQMQQIADCPDDRLRKLIAGHSGDPRPVVVKPWAKGGRHIVVAAPTPTYAKFHAIEGWTDRTLERLATFTDRQIVVRTKQSKRPLAADLEGAHALVAHASMAAVEAVILGCPVFVDKSSAAALVGQTDLAEIERPAYPERQAWLNALAYSQFSEAELVDGTLWRLIA
jgi:hypothetical protein